MGLVVQCHQICDMRYPHLEPNKPPLTLTLNFDKYINPIIENYDNENNLIYDKNKANLFFQGFK